VIAFVARPSEAPHAESLPVEFVSDTQFSQLTTGVKNAPQPVENAKPLADKVGEQKLVSELAPKVADKPEIRTDSSAAEAKTQPKKQAKSEKSEPKSEPKAEPKPAEKAEKQKPKPDQVADEPKKDETKKPPKPEKKQHEFKPDQIAEELRKEETKKPRPAPKFDANQVASLLDHREPQRQVATADTLNSVAALGAPSGSAAHLSQSELDALRAKLFSYWSPPPAAGEQDAITVRVRLGRDHRLIGRPEILAHGDGPLFEATRDSVMRALLRAQPYDMLSLTTYDLWKEIEINFNTKDLLGG
jgi:colicin import membrane protein